MKSDDVATSGKDRDDDDIEWLQSSIIIDDDAHQSSMTTAYW